MKPTILLPIGFVIVGVCCFFAGKLHEKQSCSNNNNLRAYQLEIYNDSTIIWDGDRRVAKLNYDSTSAFDKAINLDNE